MMRALGGENARVTFSRWTPTMIKNVALDAGGRTLRVMSAREAVQC